MVENDVQKNLILSRAKAAVLSRDFTLASRLYKGLLRTDPENTFLLSELGSLFVKSNQDERALPLYKEIVRLEPQNINALNSLGAIYRRLKKYEDSIAVLEQALVIDEDNVQVYYNLGFTYKLMGKYDDAIQCFETVVDENPNDVLAFNHIGSIYSLTNQNEKAIASFQRGLKIDPNHPILHLNLAKSYEHTNKFDKAIQEYEAALRSKPGWLDAIDDYADLLIKKNQTDSASDLVKQALRLNPKNVKMRTKMGNVYSRQSSYKNAEDEYNAALEIEPDNEKALSGLADAYEADDKNVDAITTMKKIESLKPGDNSMLKQYSKILLTASKLNAASKKIKEVWDQNPNDVQTINLLGQYYILRGNNSKALGCFKKIESIEPSYTDHYRDGAKRYRQIGQYNKAEKYCLKYLETSPKDPIALSLLAADYENLDRYADALKYYRKSLEEDKDNVAYKANEERVNSRITNSIQKAIAGDDDKNLNEDFATDDSLEIKMDSPESEIEDMPDENIAPEEENDDSDELKKEEDDFDFESLTKEDTKPEAVLNPEVLNEDAIDVDDDKENSKDLDDLIPEDDPIDSDENDFFKDNPFGSEPLPSSKDNGPVEDEVEPDFETEDLDDEKKSGEPITMKEIPDDDEAVEDDAFGNLDDEPKKQNPLPKNKPEPKEEPELPEEDLEPPLENDSEQNAAPVEEEIPENEMLPDDDMPAEDLPEFEEDEDESLAEKPKFEEEPDVAPAPEEELTAEEPEVAPASEEELLPEEMDDMQKIEPPLDTLPEESSGTDVEEPEDNSFVLQEPNMPDISAADVIPSLPEQDITPPNFEDSEDVPEVEPEDIVEAEPVDVTAPAEIEELPAEQADDSEIQELDSTEAEMFDKATSNLPDIVNAIVDKKVVDKFCLTAEMFEKLKSLSNYLPPEKKRSFLQSNTHLLLDYIIARLTGKPGLLATAAALRKKWNISEEIPSNITGQDLAVDVLGYMRSLINALPDQDIAASLDGAVSQTLAKLNRK